jgi:hypothetical protein
MLNFNTAKGSSLLQERLVRMRLPLLYRKKGPAHIWQLLHEVSYKYQFAVAVAVPASDLFERFVWEYLAAITRDDYDSCAIFADGARAGPVGEAEFYAGLGRLLDGEDVFLNGVRVKKFTLLSEDDETFLAGKLHRFAWKRNLVIVNSSRPYLWDYMLVRMPMTLVYFIDLPLQEQYLGQGFMLIRFDPDVEMLGESHRFGDGLKVRPAVGTNEPGNLAGVRAPGRLPGPRQAAQSVRRARWANRPEATA